MNITAMVITDMAIATMVGEAMATTIVRVRMKVLANCILCGSEYTMNMPQTCRHIDTENVTCCNEVDPGSIKGVFKTWDKRLDRTKFVESDCDEELIINIPFVLVFLYSSCRFNGMVKLASFCIIGGPEGSSPSKMKLYINQEGLDFDTAEERAPVQEFDLAENLEGEIEYPVKYLVLLCCSNTQRSYAWGDVNSISFYICGNWGADRTRIYYIGLKGSFIPVQRKAVITNYETRPIPDKNKLSELAGQTSIF
jgi:hypothetical protein